MRPQSGFVFAALRLFVDRPYLQTKSKQCRLILDRRCRFTAFPINIVFKAFVYHENRKVSKIITSLRDAIPSLKNGDNYNRDSNPFTKPAIDDNNRLDDGFSLWVDN